MNLQSLLSLSIKTKIVRFPLVGILSSLIYTTAASVGIVFLGMGAVSASLLAYLVAMPFSFFGHRNFTFEANGHYCTEFIKFCVIHAIGLAVSLGASLAVDYLHWHWVFGVLAAVILVPVVSFFFLDRWVFARA